MLLFLLKFNVSECFSHMWVWTLKWGVEEEHNSNQHAYTEHLLCVCYQLFIKCLLYIPMISNFYFLFWNTEEPGNKIPEHLINQILKSNQNLDVIHYVALLILNCREGYGFTYSNTDRNSHTIKPVYSVGMKKTLFTKGADIYKHLCCSRSSMRSSAYVISLNPQTLYRAKPNLCIWGSKGHILSIIPGCYYKRRKVCQ